MHVDPIVRLDREVIWRRSVHDRALKRSTLSAALETDLQAVAKREAPERSRPGTQKGREKLSEEALPGNRTKDRFNKQIAIAIRSRLSLAFPCQCKTKSGLEIRDRLPDSAGAG